MSHASDQCANCGGDRGIHHYQTDQCPVGGREAPIGREQEWRTSTWATPAPPFEPPPGLARDMTIRAHFAAAAMPGMLASIYRHPHQYKDQAFESVAVGVASHAVQVADALLAELNKE